MCIKKLIQRCRCYISKYTCSFSITEIRLYKHLVVKNCVFKDCGNGKILCYLYFAQYYSYHIHVQGQQNQSGWSSFGRTTSRRSSNEYSKALPCICMSLKRVKVMVQCRSRRTHPLKGCNLPFKLQGSWNTLSVVRTIHSAIWLVPPQQGAKSRQLFLRMLPGSLLPSFWRESLGTYTSPNWKCVSETRIGHRVRKRFHFWFVSETVRGRL